MSWIDEDIENAVDAIERLFSDGNITLTRYRIGRGHLKETTAALYHAALYSYGICFVHCASSLTGSQRERERERFLS